MRIKLLHLFRNYRNIENAAISAEGITVVGHFDKMILSDISDNKEIIEKVYEINGSDDDSINVAKEAQPIVLISLDDEDVKNSINDDNCFTVVSFLQFGTQFLGNNINEFYYKVKDKILNIIDNKNISADVFIPLSFMNTAVIFKSKDFNCVCELIKSLIADNVVDYQYSILALPKKSFVIPTSELNVSLRIIWKQHENVKK